MRQPGSDQKQWQTLSILAVPLFMMLLDVTIVNIAIPHIMLAFNVGITDIEWILNIYVLIFAALLITLGRLGDIYGRKIMFLSGLGVFTIASLLCGLAPTFTLLLVARGIQAIGAAAMLPATLSILNVIFANKNRGLALGIWGAVAGAANALGPVIGGALVSAYSWRWIFLVNIPIGVIAFIVAIRMISESKDVQTSPRIDVPGVTTISISLFSLTYALVEGQKYGWTSAVILSLFAASLVSFIAFIFIQLRSKSPLVRLGFFRNVTFSTGNGVSLTVTFGLLGVIFLLALFLQLVLGFSAIKAGLTLLPMPVAIMVIAPFAGRLSDRIGSRWLLFAGMLIAALGIYLLSNLTVSTTEQELILPLAICGIGMGLVIAPTTTAVMASVPVNQSGAAAGILATTRQVGSVLGLAVTGAILQNRLVANIGDSLKAFPQIPESLRDRILESINSGTIYVGTSFPDVPGPLRNQLIALFNQQFAISLNSAMKLSIYICITGAVIALFVRSHVRRGQDSKNNVVTKS